jgi:hypothetical protein
LGLAIAAFPTNEGLWALVYQAELDNSFFSAEDSTGVVIVRPEADQFVMYSNGLHQGEFPANNPPTVLGLVPALMHPNPESVLVVGLGSGVTAYSVGVNPGTRRILVAEILTAEYPLLDALAQAGIGDHIPSLFREPRYEHFRGDGRRLLAATGDRFDIIESDAVHFIASGSGALFSHEFYQAMRDRLADGGIVSHWGAHGRFVLPTFLSVYPHVVQIGDNLLLGANGPITFDQEDLLARLANPAIASYFEASGADLDRVRSIISEGPIRRWGPDSPRPDSPINTDLQPRDEYFLNSAGS